MCQGVSLGSCWDNLLPQACDWCPICCKANRAMGQNGVCGANDTCLVARSPLHFWEEPPISGTIGGPSRGLGPGSGTIFFANCSVGCVYCQNRQISGVQELYGSSLSQVKNLQVVNIDELVNMMLELQDLGAMNINFVTGTHYRSHIISAVRIAQSLGLTIPTVWNTSGYETIASISALNSCIDVWLPDFKYADNDLAMELSGKAKLSNYSDVALEAIAQMLEFTPEPTFDVFCQNPRMLKGIIVRHMILPGHISNSKQSLKMLYSEFGNKIKYSILNQYTPVIDPKSQAAIKFPELLKPVPDSEYEEVLDFADNLGIEDYYWQQGGSVSTSFIPKF